MTRILPINLIAALLCIACLGCNQSEIEFLSAQVNDLEEELSECQQARNDSEARIQELTVWKMASGNKTYVPPHLGRLQSADVWRFKAGNCPFGYCFEWYTYYPKRWEIFMPVDVKEHYGYMDVTGSNGIVFRLTYN